MDIEAALHLGGYSDMLKVETRGKWYNLLNSLLGKIISTWWVYLAKYPVKRYFVVTLLLNRWLAVHEFNYEMFMAQQRC